MFQGMISAYPTYCPRIMHQMYITNGQEDSWNAPCTRTILTTMSLFTTTVSGMNESSEASKTKGTCRVKGRARGDGIAIAKPIKGKLEGNFGTWSQCSHHAVDEK